MTAFPRCWCGWRRAYRRSAAAARGQRRHRCTSSTTNPTTQEGISR